RAAVRTINKSVFDLAKRSAAAEMPGYDAVMCAGVFDYLTDRLCKRVVESCLAKTAAGGTVLVTNVCADSDNFIIETLLEWELILRDVADVRALLPEDPSVQKDVFVDSTGTNVIAQLTRGG